MKFSHTLTKRLALFISPLATSLTVAVAPTLAATFASSEASVLISNFSHQPNSSLTSTKANSLTIATIEKNSVNSIADVSSSFLKGDFPFAVNNNWSQGDGQGLEYFGMSATKSQVLGDFFIDKCSENTPFSFDFSGSLSLQTKIEKHPNEYASAKGSIDFLLLGKSEDSEVDYQILDFLKIASQINTRGTDVLPYFSGSNNNFEMSLFSSDEVTGLELDAESANITFLGSYNREFNSPMHLKLIQVSQTQVVVRAPEPSMTLALFFGGGWAFLCLRNKGKLRSLKLASHPTKTT